MTLLRPGSGGQAPRLAPHQAAALKAAFRRGVTAFGGQQALEAATGMRQQLISDIGNPNSEMLPRVDHIRRLEELTTDTFDHPAVTRCQARLAGYALVKLPSGAAAEGVDLHDYAATLAKESGEVLAQLARALKDSAVTPAEAQALMREISEAQQVLAELTACLEPIADSS